METLGTATAAQDARNGALLKAARYLDSEITSQVLPLQIDIDQIAELETAQVAALEGLGIEAARIAILSLASLAKIKELDHLGGGLELIGPRVRRSGPNP